MSIALQAKVAELERRVEALEGFLGQRAKEYVERHFDKAIAFALGNEGDLQAERTLARTTLTLPEKRKSA